MRQVIQADDTWPGLPGSAAVLHPDHERHSPEEASFERIVNWSPISSRPRSRSEGSHEDRPETLSQGPAVPIYQRRGVAEVSGTEAQAFHVLSTHRVEGFMSESTQWDGGTPLLRLLRCQSGGMG